MESLINKTVIILILGFIINSCKQNEVDGIIIDKTLYIHLNYQENKELRGLIKQTLEKNSDALKSLKDFYCGGGAGCYD